MTDVPRNEFQVVVEGRGCDLQIRVRQHVAGLFEVRANLPEHCATETSKGGAVTDGGTRSSMFFRWRSRAEERRLP